MREKGGGKRGEDKVSEGEWGERERGREKGQGQSEWGERETGKGKGARIN